MKKITFKLNLEFIIEIYYAFKVQVERNLNPWNVSQPIIIIIEYSTEKKNPGLKAGMCTYYVAAGTDNEAHWMWCWTGLKWCH